MSEPQIYTGVIVDDSVQYNIVEICHLCGAETAHVVEMVRYGILTPEGKNKDAWKFPATQMLRLQRALRLEHDLELDLSGVALALELLQEMDAMQSRIELLEHQLHSLNVDLK